MKWLWLPVSLVQSVLALAYTAFCGLAALFLRIFLPPRPVVHFISRVLWAHVISTMLLVRVRVKGRKNIPSVPAIYVSNHASQLDILAMVRAIPVPLFFVAKKELEKVPVLGQYMHAMGMIFIDRRNKEKSMASLRRAIERIREGYDVITFPEGTRTKSGKLLMFRRGTFVIACEGRIPIVPVAISGSRALLPSGSFLLSPGMMRVQIGAPVQPDEFRDMTPEELATTVRERIARMLGADDSGYYQ